MSIGIDIGSNGLKLIQVRRLGGRTAVTAAARWVPSRGADRNGAAGRALAEILRRAPHPPPRAVVGLTGRDVNLRYAAMPPVAPHILRAMMRHEVEQDAGPSAEDVYTDYCITAEPPKRSKQGEYHVVIGRAKRQVVDERLELAAGAGLRETDACPNSLALYQAVAAGGQVGPDEVALAVDLGAENLEFVLVQGRKLLFGRNVSQGAKIFTDAIAATCGVTEAEAERIKVEQADMAAAGEEEAVPGLAGALRTAAGQLAKVIQSSASFARVQLKQSDLKPAKCLLSGGGARVRGFREYLQGALGMPVEWNDPFQAVDTSALPDEVSASLRAAPTDMALALGLALAGSPRGAPVRLSLLPPGRKHQRASRRRAVLTVAAGLLYALGLGALAATARHERSRAETDLALATERLQKYDARVEEFERLRAAQQSRAGQAELLSNEVKTGRAVLDTLSRLQRLLPAGMWVSSVALDRLENPGEAACAGDVLVVRVQSDEGSVKDAYKVPLRIAAQMSDPREASDPGGAVSAEASEYKPLTGRPGWGEFTFTICIPQYEPPDEKPADEAEAGSQ